MEAAFFDLDKTVIAKASMAAFGRPFYRGGLINRRPSSGPWSRSSSTSTSARASRSWPGSASRC